MAEKSRFALTPPSLYCSYIRVYIYLAAACFIARQTLSVFLSSVCFSSSKQSSTCVALLPTCILHSSFLYLTSDCLASFSFSHVSSHTQVGKGEAPPRNFPAAFFTPAISERPRRRAFGWLQKLARDPCLIPRPPPPPPSCLSRMHRWEKEEVFVPRKTRNLFLLSPPPLHP